MKIALVGSPNVGKSVIFGCLTGQYVTVSNYPGTTVEVSRGSLKHEGKAFEVIDTPGLYSLYSVTEEEKVTYDILRDERPDLILHVVDAKNLERMLPLTFQLQATGIPMILVLNMFDEARNLGITVDTSLLSSKIGMPVVATVAVEKVGIGQLLKEVENSLKNSEESEERCWMLPKFSENYLESLSVKARQIVSSVFKKTKKKFGLSKLDKFLLSPFTGFIILAAVLYFGLYKFVGSLGAGEVVNILEGGFEKYLSPHLTNFVAWVIPWESLRGLFTGEYGILTLGVRYAFAIILPIVGFFFLIFALLEDSGYLPRVAYLLDGTFKRIGLSGRAVIPMILGLGCDTMATMVTRTLPTKRERFIATLLLALCIPCSAQIGVILGMLGAYPKVLVAWFVIIFGIFMLVGFVLSKLVPGVRPSFIMELPPMRIPQFKNVLVKTYARMEWYFKEIVPLFVLASAIIWLCQITGIFDYITKGIAFGLSLMGLPSEAAKAFLFGFFRRDYGAAGLYDLNRQGLFTGNQLLIAVVVLTLFLPCITQFLITIKERGLKAGLGISVFVFLFAFIVGVLMNLFFVHTGINF